VQPLSATQRAGSVPRWLLGLGLAACVPTAVEMALLSLGTGFFTDGFNSVVLESLWLLPVFVGLSLTVDAALLLLLWGLLAPLVRTSGMRGSRAWWVLLMVGAWLPALLAAYRYNVYAVAGDMFNIALLSHISVSSSSSMVGELVSGTSLLWISMAALALVAILVGTALPARLEARYPRWSRLLDLPRPWLSVAAGGSILLMVALLTRLPGPTAAQLRYGLERKSADIVTTWVLAFAADVDGDGFGPLSSVRDPAPFDGSRHPYAREIVDNGVDENGLGGDLSSAHAIFDRVRAPLDLHGPRPHVLLLYLESFREDLIGQELEGREITPFLNRLADAGGSTSHAYAHAAWTLQSRSQLFGGRVEQRAGDSSLIDDFKAKGYRVAHFSGQDESYGKSQAVLGVERADHFYHARFDMDRRSSRSTTPVSLQVSWKVLLERVEAYLDEYDAGAPLFLYVNIVDTHFPYVHDELDDILGAPPLERGEIRMRRAERVREGYANAAANVDRACERTTVAFREAIGGADHAVLVLADHGEGLYERGRLGHGQTVDGLETRVPFIVWGIGGEWTVPLAVTDVRGLLRRNLPLERGDGPPIPRFVPDPSRRILQYAPSLERPEVIALRGLDRVVSYDFTSGRMADEQDPAAALRPAVSAGPDPELDELIWRWEAARLAADRGQ